MVLLPAWFDFTEKPKSILDYYRELPPLPRSSSAVADLPVAWWNPDTYGQGVAPAASIAESDNADKTVGLLDFTRKPKTILDYYRALPGSPGVSSNDSVADFPLSPPHAWWRLGQSSQDSDSAMAGPESANTAPDPPSAMSPRVPVGQLFPPVQGFGGEPRAEAFPPPQGFGPNTLAQRRTPAAASAPAVAPPIWGEDGQLLPAPVPPSAQILSRTVEAANAGFGDEPLGLSPETRARYPLIDLIFQRHAEQLDALGRAPRAALWGLAAAAGEAYRQAGGSDAWANRLTRDLIAAGETALLASGAAYPRTLTSTRVPVRQTAAEQPATRIQTRSPGPLRPGDGSGRNEIAARPAGPDPGRIRPDEQAASGRVTQEGRETGPSDSQPSVSTPPPSRSEIYHQARRELQDIQELLTSATRNGEPQPGSIAADVVANLRQRIAEAETAVKLAKRAKLAEQMTINRVAGRRFEQDKFHAVRTGRAELAPQITVRTKSGDRARLDFLLRNGDTVECIECKASETAPHTPNQKKVYPEIARSGATIVGRGKPGFPGGMVIPPTRVRIIGPKGSSQ